MQMVPAPWRRQPIQETRIRQAVSVVRCARMVFLMPSHGFTVAVYRYTHAVSRLLHALAEAANACIQVYHRRAWQRVGDGAAVRVRVLLRG